MPCLVLFKSALKNLKIQYLLQSTGLLVAAQLSLKTNATKNVWPKHLFCFCSCKKQSWVGPCHLARSSPTSTSAPQPGEPDQEKNVCCMVPSYVPFDASKLVRSAKD